MGGGRGMSFRGMEVGCILVGFYAWCYEDFKEERLERFKE